MLIIESSQLACECKSWIDALRSSREKFQNQKSLLMELALHQHQKDLLLEIEHLDNQLHIQLVNIHDLKQTIKKHVNKLTFEKSIHSGYLSDELLARHEYLYDEFLSLDSTLLLITREFERFTRYIRSATT